MMIPHWRHIRIPLSTSIALYLVAWVISEIWNMIAYGENSKEHFWAAFGIHIFTWLTFEKVYKQTKYEQMLDEIRKKKEQDEQV